jgi:hypothetical protein
MAANRERTEAHEQELIDGWKKSLEAIRNQITYLVMDHHIYVEVCKTIASNQTARQSSEFRAWLVRCYASAVCMRIRRQAKSKKGEVGLKSLLMSIKENCSLVSRERHVAIYCATYADPELDPGRRRRAAIRNFRSLVEADVEHLPEQLVDDHLKVLEQTTVNVTKYADKRIAHHDKAFDDSPLRFGEVEAAVKELERIVLLYGCLLEGGSYGDSLLPTFQHDWTLIFRAP